MPKFYNSSEGVLRYFTPNILICVFRDGIMNWVIMEPKAKYVQHDLSSLYITLFWHPPLGCDDFFRLICLTDKSSFVTKTKRTV